MDLLSYTRDKIKSIRLANSYTQTQVAQSLGITLRGYSHYELGERDLSLETLNRLLVLYNLSPQEFFKDF
jgi:transcriptional regulator with XRE-family HTH domain